MHDRAVGAGTRDGGKGDVLELAGIAAKAFKRLDRRDLAERAAGGRALEPGEEAEHRAAVAPVLRVGARDLDAVLDRLHLHDRVGTAAELAARPGDLARQRIGGG